MRNQKSYFRYWGKAKQLIEVDYCLSNGTDEDIAKRNGISLKELMRRVEKHQWKKVPAGQSYSAFHLLPYHSFDVAAVASVWWDQSKAIRNSFLWKAADLSNDQIKAWVLFYISIHDYGKFDIRFQRKALNVWKILQSELNLKAVVMPTVDACKTYDHGTAGLYWFDRDHDSDDDSDAFNIMMDINENTETTSEDAGLTWVKAVAGHHGFVYSESMMPSETRMALHSTVSKSVAKQDKAARLEWIATLEEIFLKPAGLSLDDIPPQPSPMLAGFCSVSDWLGSRSDEENFRYKSEPTTMGGLKAYFDEKCQQDALHVFKLSGIGGQAKSYQSVKALLDKDRQPRQVQTLVNELSAEPGLTIVEAPTGSGKTEMALAYAWRLLENNHADSIVFAMPTQATSNAMLKRLEKLATILFEENPNLLLAHGNAHFNEDFLALKQVGKTVQENEEAWAQCNEWLGQSRKRIFLGQIGICTVDQVLVSVLPVKHRFVRGFGVGRSVLIVDEVHAYDAYMYGLLEAVLREQQATGGSSILLSATLPQTLKNNLLATSGVKPSEPTELAPYPMISYSDGQQAKQFTLPDSQLPPKREVSFELNEDEHLLPDEALCQRIISAAEDGAQVAIICNLVDVAQQLAKQLQAMVEQRRLGIETDIFHARYCLTHRQHKEALVLEYFGEEGERHQGRILVATQVIEQSLDVDFDWLITQLCPVDLLFQRMGRLHRHERKRPQGFETPLCTILLPLGHDYGTHGLIYSNTRVMWRTARKLHDCPEQVIKFPVAYREWIETVYQNEAWGNEPAEVEDGFSKFEDKTWKKRVAARQMLKWADDASLNDSDEKIRAVTRDGEFSLSVVPCLETPEGMLLLSGVIFESLDEWRQAEALSMSTVGAPNSWGKGRTGFLPEQDENGYIWLAMQTDGDYLRVTRNDIELSYHPYWGLERRDY
ncbi:MAG: CRISPR-associated helicase/endonuclease Cas3 [Pseudomonadota bacterium]